MKTMKSLIAALLIASAASSGFEGGDKPLATCYTGIPFSEQLGYGIGLRYKAFNAPSFVKISEEGIISGTPTSPGAYPVIIQASDSKGNTVTKNILVNVADTQSNSSIWATGKNSYYSREVTNPLTVSVTSPVEKLAVKTEEDFRVTLGTANNQTKVVYGYLNLPEGLSGDAGSGEISGKFKHPGTYTFGVQAADQSGNTAEGFVTATVKASESYALTKVTVANAVPFVYDLDKIQKQQNSADKHLFEALASVNDLKAEVAGKQATYNALVAKLAAAEILADQAAATAAAANADRTRASAQLAITNKALNDAEDQLNLALLYQTGAKAGVTAAQSALDAANDALNSANAVLDNANDKLQAAQSVLTKAVNAQTNAATAFNNSQKDLNRAADDLNEAKDALAKAIDIQQKAKVTLKKAIDKVELAQQAYNIAQDALTDALANLAKKQIAKDAALKALSDFTNQFQKAQSVLGAAEWDLSQAVAALNVAKAAKEAADRTSAAVIANGVPLAKQDDTPSAAESFKICDAQGFPGFYGAAKIVKNAGNRYKLSTGQTVVTSDCTKGKEYLAEGEVITVRGSIDVQSNIIQAYECQKARY